MIKKEVYSIIFKGASIVYFQPVPKTEMVVPESGLITKSRIIRKLKNGTSETTWGGKLKVKTGDKVYLNSVTGEITVKGEVK